MGHAHLAIFGEWYRRGDLNIAALVTNRYSLDELNNGVQDLCAGKVLGRAIIEL